MHNSLNFPLAVVLRYYFNGSHLMPNDISLVNKFEQVKFKIRERPEEFDAKIDVFKVLVLKRGHVKAKLTLQLLDLCLFLSLFGLHVMVAAHQLDVSDETKDCMVLVQSIQLDVPSKILFRYINLNISLDSVGHNFQAHFVYQS